MSDIQEVKTDDNGLTPKNSEPVLHYYSLVYHDDTKTAAVYIGYPEQKITMARIQSGKEQAGVNPNAVLLMASYLGHMTPSEMTGLGD